MTLSKYSTALLGISVLLAAPIAVAQSTAPSQPSGTGNKGCDYSYDSMKGGKVSAHADEGQVVQGRLATFVCHNGQLVKQN
jgi:hypothetical protein